MIRIPGTVSRDADDAQLVVGGETDDGVSPLKAQSATPALSAEKTIVAEKDHQALTPSESSATLGASAKAADSGQANVIDERAASPQPTTSSAAPAEAVAAPTADDAAAPKPPETPELTPTGSTDLDRTESDDMKLNLTFVRDGTLDMNEKGMPAYYRILSWVDHQPTELLRKRAHRDVTWNDFRRTPDLMRLQIVELKLNVRQILRCFGPPKDGKDVPITTPDGHQLYQLCGFTQESGSNIYYGIVSDLPKGMPIGTFVNENVKLVGYFFKLQGYYSKQQQLDAEETGKRPTMLKAPVIIGRAIWIIPPAVAEEKTPLWLVATIGAVAVVVIVGWVLLAAKKTARRHLADVVPGTSRDPEGGDVNNWLDQAQSGRLSLEPVPESTASSDGAALTEGLGTRMSGNIFRGNDESTNGHHARNGSGADDRHSNDRLGDDKQRDNRDGGSDPEVHGNPSSG